MCTTQQAPSPRKLVIGFGDGDEALGWEVASRLAASIADETVDVRLTTHLTPDLVEPISQAEVVIFVDVSHEGQPGEWSCEEIFPGVDLPAASEHEPEAERLMEYSRLIFHAKPRAVLVSLSTGEAMGGRQLSLVPDEVIARVVEFIRGMVDVPQAV